MESGAKRGMANLEEFLQLMEVIDVVYLDSRRRRRRIQT
jgi:hypothetical protein